MSQPASKISVGLSHRELPNRAYISTRTFDTANAGSGGATSGSGTLYLYTTSLNAQFQTVGGLSKNALATTTNCPAGRVVHANGKMLIPGVHPGGGPGVNPATGSGTTTPATLPFPMIGVYDPVSGLNGYINPQDSTWALYDASLVAFYDNAGTPDSVLAGQGSEPRYGRVFIGDTTVANPAAVNISSARTGIITFAAGSTPATTLVVSSTEVSTSSVIMLTFGKSNATGTNAAVNAFVSAISPGTSFTITFTNATSVATAPAVADRISFIIIN